VFSLVTGPSWALAPEDTGTPESPDVSFGEEVQFDAGFAQTDRQYIAPSTPGQLERLEQCRG
jgi:hypothetical protein